MASKHLLPCSCGQPILVSTSQAGETVNCECGVAVEVPSLRGLRELPVSEAETTNRGGWGFRQGVLSAGLLVAFAVLGAAGWLRATEPEPPPKFDPEARTTIVGQGLDSLAPTDAWRLWEAAYKPLSQRGLEVFQSPGEQDLSRRIAFSQLIQSRLLIAAGAVLVGTLACFAILPK